MVPSHKSLKGRPSPGSKISVKAGNIAENDADTRIQSIEDLTQQLRYAARFRAKYGRPFITISYAQSIDGSIAARNNEPLELSGPQSWTLTHQVRAVSDAILIGIGTVLADDPRLSVRRVEGRNPQPIILDTHLRTPLDAKCVQRDDVSTWLINAKTNSIANRRALEEVGASPLTCATGTDGKIDLLALMDLLAAMKINSVMVEGGARVITSFVNARLVDQFIITIAPKFVGGLQVLNSRGIEKAQYLECEQVYYQHLGNDIIVWARPGWKAR
ncbi:MAG: RibD family protein [Deltaproteobacteria bacterium]|jgi:3,4-dihydroxy 2-butanone 4-phosphate synthase/GTP cyclohydrolase II|nr:RibD family protein [Deltaproteobacteria bacterium]